MDTLYCNACGNRLADEWQMPGDRGIYCRHCALGKAGMNQTERPVAVTGQLELATKRLRSTSVWVQKATETLRTTRQTLEAAQVAAQEALSDWHRAKPTDGRGDACLGCLQRASGGGVMAERQQVVRHVPRQGRGYEYWYGYIPRTRSWMWLLDLYENGEAIGGARYLTPGDASVHALLWVEGLVAA